MNRPVTVIVVATLAVAGVALRSRFVSAAATPGVSTADRLAEARRIRDLDITFFAERARRDPGGALDLARLAGLYYRRFRETGNSADLSHAEEAALRSLANRRDQNPAAWQTVANVRIAQHRFQEALGAADHLVDSDLPTAGALATRGEILLELGRYREADQVFTGLTLHRGEPTVAPRYARWLELRGRAGRAAALLEEARATAASALDTPPDQLAWFDLRLAELAVKFGEPARAVRVANRGLLGAPADPRLLNIKARALLALNEPRAAVALADSSLGLRFDVGTLITLADGWAAAGDTAVAAQYRRILATTLAANPETLHRGWLLDLLDHGGNADSIAAAAHRDLANRRDVYGLDLYAWARFRGGHAAEAARVMAEVRSIGTEDPLFDRHEAAIRRALELR